MEQSEQWAENTAVYHPRNPKESPLWNLLNNHYEDFERNYPQRFEKEYGFFRPVISEVVYDYLKCGDLKEGFARVRCPDCRHEYLLAFSCRGRWFCPSCHAKKVVLFGEHLLHEILYPVPHRQYVFSIPKILRTYFKYDRKLLGKLCHCANISLLTFLRTVIGIEDGVLGAVMTIHTFGDYCRWHPHLHAIAADGLFRDNGMFYVMPKNADLDKLAAIFRANVLQMMKKEGKIGDALIKTIMGWRHMSGFSVHNGVRIARDDEKGKEALAQYIIRNPFSEKKLTYKEDTGMVIYKSKMTHGKDKKNFLVVTAEEFIAAIIQHIPEKSFQMVRYYGYYSNKARGVRAKEAELAEQPDSTSIPDEIEVVDVSSYKPRRIPSKTWRDCIKKVWEVDPLKCPKCQAQMKIISFITKSQADVLRQILEHLGVWEEEIRPPPENEQPPKKDITHEPFDDGWPGYEEPFITVD